MSCSPLAAIRKERHLTQQALAELANVHVSQIRKYETGVGQPTLDVLRRLAVAMSVPTDLLVFDKDERGPDDELRLHFEAVSRLDPDERQLVKGLIESVVLKHDVRRGGVNSTGERTAMEQLTATCQRVGTHIESLVSGLQLPSTAHRLVVLIEYRYSLANGSKKVGHRKVP